MNVNRYSHYGQQYGGSLKNLNDLYDLAVLPLGLYPDKTIIQKDTCSLMCIAALFTIAKKWMKPNRWMSKMWCVCVCIYIYSMKNYSTIKKNEKLPFSATWMELDIPMLNDTRKKKTNIIWYQLHVEYKIWHKWAYLWNRNKLTDIETVVDKLRGGARGGGINLKFGISRIKLLCIEQINNKVLL